MKKNLPKNETIYSESEVDALLKKIREWVVVNSVNGKIEAGTVNGYLNFLKWHKRKK